MKLSFKYFYFIIFLLLLSNIDIKPQQRVTERGSSNFRKVGVHRGNQVRTVFSNYGVIAQPGEEGPRGAWKFDANGYVGDVSPLVGVRLPIADYWRGAVPPDGINDTIYSVVITPVNRPGGGEGGGGKSYTFEPIPNFANPTLDEVGKGVAMSHLPETWPNQWLEYPDWTYSGDPIIIDGEDKSPEVDWNGFFGRGQQNADQESYFWMDDNNDEENYLVNQYTPDINDASRRGHGLQVSVRGLQWSNFLAQDVVFWLYNIKNDGTKTYDQAVFGTIVGTYVGVEDPEWNDDASFFNVRESITYTWDFDHYINPAANPQWLPDPTQVGYIAYAFLESPGNGYDGIDNDGDNALVGSANFFTADDFPGVNTVSPINAGDQIILIDKATFVRTPFTVPSDTVTVTSMDVKFFIQPGVTKLVEGIIDVNTGNPIGKTARDGIDNDLDGIIDENYQVHYRQFKKSGIGANAVILIDTIAPVQYRDYLTGIDGNPLLDEKRDDGIDNDGDWDPQFDDNGADGKPGTLDFGEGDGIPTPGETNFDATDIDESDQIGLTSFDYFVPAGAIAMSNDDNMWTRMLPGYFQVPASIVNNVAIRGEDGDFLYGSGYFPLLAGRTERFSLALAFGIDYRAVLKTKQVAQTIYNANYNFPRPPEKPTVTAVAENGKVTLYWDRVAEESVDPTLRVKDFEGYKIYKGTDPDLTDALQITNSTGEKVFYRPIAQYDLIDGIKGIFESSSTLLNLTDGAPYNMGTDNGIQNFFIDNDVINGRTYYYAVVAYDQGDVSKDIYPSENTRFISKDAIGNISTDINTVAVTPVAPVAGYVPPPSGLDATRNTGVSTPTPYFEVIDPYKVKNNNYKINFNNKYFVTAGDKKDSVNISDKYSVTDLETGNKVVENETLLPANGIVFDGVRLSIDSSYQTIDSVRLDANRSIWNIKRAKNLGYQATQAILIRTFTGDTIIATKYPRDYMIVIRNSYSETSNTLSQFLPSPLPAKTVNFSAYDITNKNSPVKVQFGFLEVSTFRRDTLSYNDVIYLSDSSGSDFSWRILFIGDTASKVPVPGDTLFLYFNKPFSGGDEFTFTTSKPSYSIEDAREQLQLVKAVPNPYIVANVFEEPLPTTVRGRGERVIYFINVPPQGKIHIYTSSGNLVRTLEHDGSLNSGSVEWDLKTKEGLDVAYGVYFYVVEVEGISDKKTGKLAIIK